jgi:hypothetical protein
MQTISLEEELKLIDGIPYNINFEQDFSKVCLDGYPITDIPVTSIIESIGKSKAETEAEIRTEPWTCNVNKPIVYSAEDYRRNQEFRELIDKHSKEEERKREKKWKKERKKDKKKQEKFIKGLGKNPYIFGKRNLNNDSLRQVLP